MQIVKQANISKVGQQLTEPTTELNVQKDVHNDSSSEDTVSTSESPHHEMQTDFAEGSIVGISAHSFNTSDK